MNDLDAFIADLHAWFPKRSKVEDYKLIAVTVGAINENQDGDIFEELYKGTNNPWGLSEGDILGISRYERK